MRSLENEWRKENNWDIEVTVCEMIDFCTELAYNKGDKIEL